MAVRRKSRSERRKEGGETSVLDVGAEKYSVYLVWTGLLFYVTPPFFFIL